MRYILALTLLVFMTSTSTGQENSQDTTLSFAVEDERLKMKINEDRKSCEKQKEQLRLKVYNLERQVEVEGEKVSTYLAKEQRYKDNEVAYKLKEESHAARIADLEKANKKLKLKSRLTSLAAVILPVVVFLMK